MKHITSRHLMALIGVLVLGVSTLPALGSDGHEPALARALDRAAHEAKPETVHIAFHTYGFSVAPLGQTSLLTVRLVGPKRALLLDERTAGETIDWSLPGGALDGSYRYEVFVNTTSLNGTPEGHLTPGGFEVLHGQIVRP